MEAEEVFITKMKNYFTEFNFSDFDLGRIKMFLQEYKKDTPERIVYKDREVIKEKIKQVVVFKDTPARILKFNTAYEIINNEEASKNIISEACAFFNVTPVVIKRKCRKAEFVLMRYMIFYIIRTETTMSLTEIAALFNSDHTTILHGIRKIKIHIELNPIIKNRFDKLYEFISAKQKTA